MTLEGGSFSSNFLNREFSYYRVASQHADDGLVVQQLDGKILWANPAYCKLMGYQLDEILGVNPLSFCMPPGDRLSDEDIARFRYDPEQGHERKLVLARNQHRSGRIFWMQISHSFHHYADGTDIVILVCRDVSAQILKEQQLRKTTAELEHLANFDYLTGLANRAALTRFLEQTFCKGSETQTGVLQIDMDRFKAINDTHGHSAGDKVLQHVADKLRATIRPGDFAARLGGDEFVVVCPNVPSLNELEQIGERISTAIDTPVPDVGFKLICRPSIGACLSDHQALPPEEILRRADFALYEAKRIGQGHVAVYNKDLHIRQQAETQMAVELTAAVAQRELVFYFQPTLSLRSGTVLGFETLVRWDHPELGMISPDDFLPLARRLGLMAEIDFQALDAAVAMKARLNTSDHRDIRIGINGSEELLNHPDFFDHLTRQMSKHRILPDEMLIELLETVVFEKVSSSNPLVAIVKRLHDYGITTLLDDFGTGHAGLAHMAKLAVNGIKIDRSLTMNMLREPTCAKIMAMIIDLCSDLDFYVVTEGIETAEEAQALIDMGGDVIQGYWLSRPMPADAVLPWLANRPQVEQLLGGSAIAPAPAPRYLGAKS